MGRWLVEVEKKSKGVLREGMGREITSERGVRRETRGNEGRKSYIAGM